MAEATLPYVVSSGNVGKVLSKIIKASTPDRFTQDFLASKLGMSGGSARPVIPFLKRTGFLESDGTPTDLYNEFRNPTLRPAAAADALKTGYAPLFEAHERADRLSDDELRGLMIQLTGWEEDSRVVSAALASFKAVLEYADLDADTPVEEEPDDSAGSEEEEEEVGATSAATSLSDVAGLSIGYTINLHLPATSDIAVFNAIFKSLRDNLLR